MRVLRWATNIGFVIALSWSILTFVMLAATINGQLTTTTTTTETIMPQNIATMSVNTDGDWIVKTDKQTISTEKWEDVYDVLIPIFPYVTQGMIRALMSYVAVTHHTFVFTDASEV